jgi:peptidoglycan/xylan/chitin deacetylase (PgdA/CDA1 family)
MRRVLVILCWIALIAATAPAGAGECSSNALGTSRTLVVDPTEHPRLGTMQYLETLPLADHEVVLTFDDGPLPPYSTRILDILASECVKATYFLVGRMAQSFPGTVRRIYNEGHTIGTHSQNHPLIFDKMPIARVQQEVDEGIESVSAALGDPRALAPFFRIPGLARANDVEAYLASRSLITWSADFPADDWFRRITPQEITRRALNRIEAKGKGILLLHDIHPATALALPTLLRELKARGYHIVHVVPAGPDRPKTVTEPQQWVLHGKQGWPRIASVDAGPRLPPSPERLGIGLGYPFGPKAIISPVQDAPRKLAAAGQVPMPPIALWPREAHAVAPAEIIFSSANSGSPDWPRIPVLAPARLAEAAIWPALPIARPAQRPVLRATLRPALRPTLHPAAPRVSATKPNAPVKPARRPTVTSSLP